VRIRLDQIVVNSRRPAELVRFWAALLGGEPVDRAHGWSHVEPPGVPRLAFQPAPDAAAGENRLHLDLDVGPAGIADAVAAAVALGAEAVGDVVTDEKGSFQVMADPEGNAFCFVSG
jgi:hypothetical protein